MLKHLEIENVIKFFHNVVSIFATVKHYVPIDGILKLR